MSPRPYWKGYLKLSLVSENEQSSGLVLAPCNHSWIEPNIAPRRSLQLLNFSRRIRVRIRPAWVRRFELRCDAGSPLGAPPAIWAAIRKQSGLAEKIILPGDRDRLGCVTQIRVRATCQRDEFSLCTSKFESDHPSHAVGLADVAKCNSVLSVSLHPSPPRT